MKKHYYYFVVTSILLVGGAFYWYELRPTAIKKECYAKAYQSKNDLNSTYNGLLRDGIKAAEPDLDKFLKSEYEKCLMENGIK